MIKDFLLLQTKMADIKEGRGRGTKIVPLRASGAQSLARFDRACARPDQILWVTYEQLQAEPHATVARIAAFLEIDTSPEVVSATVAGASFGAMKTQAAALRRQQRAPPRKRGGTDHFREGAAPGGWRRRFTVAQSDAYDAAITRGLAGLPPGLVFDYGGGCVWSNATAVGHDNSPSDKAQDFP